MIKQFRSKLLKADKGMIIPTVLILSIALSVIGFSLLSYATSQHRIIVHNTYVNNTINVAEAGVELSLNALNQDSNFAGFTTEQVLFNNQAQGRGVYTTTVQAIPSSNAKTITAEGKTYRYGDTSSPEASRKIKVTVVGTGSPGYSVHSGPGGLILSGSATITNSDVYVNGFIDLNGAAKIGTASQPLNVNVANQQCPTGSNPGASYPQVCSSGEPIQFETSTKIYGNVCATGQTSIRVAAWQTTPVIEGGNGGQGLIPGCVAPPVTTPTYDKAAQVAAVAVTGAGNSNTYVCNSWPFDRTWPANLKLTGNVNVNSSCNVKIMGDTYITGDLEIGGAATMTVDNSVGGDRPVVMVDGKITVGGAARIISNNQGTGIHFISFKSSAACGSNCTTLSGTALKTSQNLETVNIGGAVNLPGMIFQAYWGKLKLSGSGSVGSAIGQTVDMQGAGTVTFGTTLSSGDTTWTITSYQRIHD